MLYEDGEWEDMTSTQLMQGMRLAQAVQERTARRAQLQGEDAPVPHKRSIALVMSPAIPADFGEAHVGEVVRYQFEHGWSRGTLRRYHPRCGAYTFDVLFNGTTEERRMRLRPGYYHPSKDGREAPISAWNLLLQQDVMTSTATNEDGIHTQAQPDDTAAASAVADVGASTTAATAPQPTGLEQASDASGAQAPAPAIEREESDERPRKRRRRERRVDTGR